MFVSRVREICERLVALELRESVRLVDRMRLIVELERLGGAQNLGFRSTAHWLAVKCRLEQRTARDYVRVAHRLERWTAVRDALAEGRLSYSQARALCRASADEDQHELLRVAMRSTVVALEQHIRALRSAPSADPEVAEDVQQRRTVQWRWSEDGALRFWGSLPPADGVALIEAIETGAGRIHAPSCCERRSGVGARRADALAELARSGCPKTTLMLHADLASLAGREGDRLHLRDGPSIPPELARRLTCDSMITVAGLNHGRTRRIISAPQRRALEARDDRVCWMPGCDLTHELDGHHIRHWTQGGRTDLDNLILLCPYHHRLFHEGGWHLDRKHGHIRVCNPDGELIYDLPAPPRARGSTRGGAVGPIPRRPSSQARRVHDRNGR